MTRIVFEKVSKRFDGRAVIRDLDLAIESGEFFVFVGPSGCGKSTVLNMIAGLEPVTGGKIYFDDLTVNSLSPRERDVAMVFQSYALYPHMNVYENLAFPLKMKKVKPETVGGEVKRVSSILGLGEVLHRKPRELSGGQRQRVALGRAIIRRPKVFLMDEPLSNLDARLRVEMRAELKRLHRELGITTVYVTHDQAEAMSLSDRIAVISEGLLQQCGTPQEVYGKPANIFVAGFMGSSPMNFIPATVSGRDPLEVDFNGILLSPVFASIPKGPHLTAAIRPEDVTVSPGKTGDAEKVEVQLTEPVGQFMIVDFDWRGLPMKGVADPDAPIRPGMKAYMRFPRDRMFFFDRDSGQRL